MRMREFKEKLEAKLVGKEVSNYEHAGGWDLVRATREVFVESGLLTKEEADKLINYEGVRHERCGFRLTYKTNYLMYIQFKRRTERPKSYWGSQNYFIKEIVINCGEPGGTVEEAMEKADEELMKQRKHAAEQKAKLLAVATVAKNVGVADIYALESLFDFYKKNRYNDAFITDFKTLFEGAK